MIGKLGREIGGFAVKGLGREWKGRGLTFAWQQSARVGAGSGFLDAGRLNVTRCSIQA